MVIMGCIANANEWTKAQLVLEGCVFPLLVKCWSVVLYALLHQPQGCITG
jgi:hypothetical protein